MGVRTIEVLTNQGQQFLYRSEKVIMRNCGYKLTNGRCARLLSNKQHTSGRVTEEICLSDLCKDFALKDGCHPYLDERTP